MKFVNRGYNLPCSKIKGWKCDICNVDFRWKKDMRNHIEFIHKIAVRRSG